MKAIFHGHEKDGGIYLIQNAANGRVYVGETIRFSDRYKQHLSRLKRGAHRNKALQSDFESGEYAFEVVAILPDQKDRRKVEKETIRFLFGPLCYNATIFSPPSSVGVKRSEETKRKLSEAMRGNQNNLGHILPQESKLKIADALRGNRNAQGRVCTEETRAKLVASGSGRNHSESTREKLRVSRLGKKLTQETRAKLSLVRTGKRQSAETKAKISLARRNRTPKWVEVNHV